MTNLTTDEIISLYTTAKDKDEQVFILAELTASDAETIIEVLKDLGIYKQINIKYCAYCGDPFIDSTKYHKATVCPSCKRLKRLGSAQFYKDFFRGGK